MIKVANHIIQTVVFISFLKGYRIVENYYDIVSLLFIQTLEKHVLYVQCLIKLLSILTSCEYFLLKSLAKFR